MGTRHLIVVVDKKGETKIAQYGQWDGYLEGQGLEVLNFLKTVNLENFATQLKKVHFLNDKEIEIKNKLLKNSSAGINALFPQLSIDMGANILSFVNESKEDKIELINSEDFSGDSLFCEFAYVIDLQKNTFEVYRGFNEKPLKRTERFYKFFDKKQEHRDTTYYPVKKIIEFKLDKLPTEKQFLKIKI